ncbi:MAG: hypothetical protein GY906_15055 [bacterium]|nr:hypothetical protein [bacterium]
MSKPKSSPKQDRIVGLLRENRVLSLEQMMSQGQCSRMTVFLALKQCGYYSSYNYNAGFYTLADIPRFDQDGLWRYDDVRFSRCRTLNETLGQLVERSEAGYTVAELEDVLGVQCRHHLSRLSEQGRLARQKLGRTYVYCASQLAAQSAQKQTRAAMSPPATAPPRPMLPPGLTARMVIRTLVVAIDQPKVNPRQLAARLRREQTEITASQVREIFDFYDLNEKRGS